MRRFNSGNGFWIACVVLSVTGCANDSADSREEPETPTEGDPGPSIVINEVHIEEDWIELFNRGSATVSLTAWQLIDYFEDDVPRGPGPSFTFGSGTSLAPGEFLVVRHCPRGTDCGEPGFAFGLGDIDEIRLLDSDGRDVHGLAWDDSLSARGAAGLHPDGALGTLAPLAPATPGAENVPVDCVAPCEASGACALVDYWCTVVDDADCKRSTACRTDARCTLRDGACVVGSDADCAQSTECTGKGLCAARNERCWRAATDRTACSEPMGDEQFDPCHERGHCSLDGGVCLALGQADCVEGGWDCDGCRNSCWASEGDCRSENRCGSD